ncbi:initiator RepB protein, partial [Enterococcus faecalis]
PTKEEQNRALELANRQTQHEKETTSLQERIKEQKRKLELLQQLEELEKQQKNRESETDKQKLDNNSDIPLELRKDLLDNLQNLFKD